MITKISYQLLSAYEDGIKCSPLQDIEEYLPPDDYKIVRWEGHPIGDCNWVWFKHEKPLPELPRRFWIHGGGE